MFYQRALFHPRGLAGHAYWRSVAPFHGIVFGGMMRNITGEAERVTAARRPDDWQRVDDLSAEQPPQQVSLYEAVGGEPVFRQLVDDFYAGVADDPVLRPLYEGDDLEPAKERLRMFLVQYWGGPTTYGETARPPAAADAARHLADRRARARRLAAAHARRGDPPRRARPARGPRSGTTSSGPPTRW